MSAKWFFIAFTVCLLITPQNSKAARFSGDYLIHMCGSDVAGEELSDGGHIACQAYISGVMDYHNLIRSLGDAPSLDFCVPEGTTLNQLQNAVVKYLQENKDEHGNFIASPGVALALYSSYPCNAAGAKK